MSQARSAAGGLNPDRITNRTQLAAALKEVKGARSYHQLTEASKVLTPSAARRAGGNSRAGGKNWMPELLVRGTVGGWLTGRHLPARNKLLTFLTVCEVPADRWRAWAAAVARVKAAPPGRTIDDWDPIELGVHRAIRVDARGRVAEGLPVLPPYVERDHDTELRASLRTGRRNQLILITGGSSVGKTRACYEAVRTTELRRWPVHYPLTADELLEQLTDGIAPGSIMWLTETQRYLSSVRGREVAVALRHLLAAPGRGETESRVVVIGSMWSRPYWQRLTRHPQPGEDDDYPEIRDLLTQFCLRIEAAEDFSDLRDEQQAQLDDYAAQDPRLGMARHAGGLRIRLTQQLAGGPLLLERYAELEQTEPIAHALLTAAMDARRIGYQSPLTASILAGAMPGYLSREQLVTSANWFAEATASATEVLHGVRALTPIRTDGLIGGADAFVLHDYLAQHALGHRRRVPIPASLWNAVVEHADDVHDLAPLADQAERRALVGIQLRIYRAWAEEFRKKGTTDRRMALRLATGLNTLGDQDAATEVLRISADAGDTVAAARLEEQQARALPSVVPLDEQGNVAGPRTTGLPADGDPYLTSQLNEMVKSDRIHIPSSHRHFHGGRYSIGYSHALLARELTDLGDITGLREHADAGNEYAAASLADLLVERGDIADAVPLLRKYADANGGYAAIRLAELLVERGDIADAVALLQKHADVDHRAARQLADLLAERGDITALRDRADAGDRAAVARLADLLVERGDITDAVALLQKHADYRAARRLIGRLIDLLVKRGDIAALRDRADAGDRAAADALIRMLVKRGDIAGLRDRADAGDTRAANRLAALFMKRGKPDGTAELRRELHAGNSRDAALALIALYAAGDPRRQSEIQRCGLTIDGFPAEPP